MQTIKRRDFLKLVGVSAAGLALKDVLWAVPDSVMEEALRGPGIETFRSTVCQLCTAGCGIRVRLIDGIPVHIDGNPMHPINHGGICPHGAAGLDFLYHPDRIRQPLVRSGQRGSGQWQPVSWEDAQARVAERMRRLREAGTAEQVAFAIGQDRGLMHEMASRFMQAYGSPNLFTVGDESLETLPFEILFGWKRLPEYDIENSQFVLSFGADFLEDGISPLHSIHAFGRMRGGVGGGRGKLAVVDARHSLTAGSADVFLPVKPGTHGALALGVAYVVIRERYYDASFVDRYVDGFESWVDENGERQPGFKDHVLENYYPERVAQITGVSARRIVDVGRDFGRIRPAVAMIGSHGSSGTNGLLNALCVLTLNVLIGNIEKRGGLRVQRPTPVNLMEPVQPDATARSSLGRPPLTVRAGDHGALRSDAVATFCENVVAGTPYPVDTLFLYGSNPAFDHPYAKKMRAVLERVPFIVSFANIMDESSEYADVILPEHAALERWMDCGSAPGVRFAHVSAGQPVVKPFYDTKHAGDVLIDLAKGVGGGVSGAFEDMSYFGALQNRLYGVFASGEGAVISGSFEESWMKFLKVRGWQNLVYESFDDFWKVLVDRGGWWDPVTEELPFEKVVETANGKVSLVLRDLLRASMSRGGGMPDRATLESWGIHQPGPAAFLPHFETPRFAGEESDFPYCLVIFGVLSNRGGSGSFSPLAQEMFGYYHRVYNDSWAEINPETAHRHHIAPGDPVELTSEVGTVRTRAVFNELVDPETIAIPFGLGHTSGAEHMKGVGVNPIELTRETSDPLWGRPVKMATRVKLRRAEGAS